MVLTTGIESKGNHNSTTSYVKWVLNVFWRLLHPQFHWWNDAIRSITSYPFHESLYILIKLYIHWIDALFPRFPKPCPCVVYLSSLGSALNQLIKCEISFKRSFYMDCNFEFLFCYLAAWHEVEQNKCKHDPQVSYNNKIRDPFNEMNSKDVCCERCGKSRRGCPKLVTFFNPTRI